MRIFREGRNAFPDIYLDMALAVTVSVYRSIGYSWAVQGRSQGLKQRGHEETPDNAVAAIVVVEEQPVVAILAG